MTGDYRCDFGERLVPAAKIGYHRTEAVDAINVTPQGTIHTVSFLTLNNGEGASDSSSALDTPPLSGIDSMSSC